MKRSLYTAILFLLVFVPLTVRGDFIFGGGGGEGGASTWDELDKTGSDLADNDGFKATLDFYNATENWRYGPDPMDSVYFTCTRSISAN